MTQNNSSLISPPSPPNGRGNELARRELFQANSVHGRSFEPRRAGRTSEPETLDTSTLLHSIRRQWRLALLLGVLLGPACALAVWFFFVPQFVAAAYLRIDANNPLLVFKTADRESGRDSFDLYKNTQSQLIKTPFVINRALEQDEVRQLDVLKQHANPTTWLADSIGVDFPGKSEIMAIRCTTEDADSAVVLLNAVVEAYMNEAVLNERNEKLARIDNLERVYADSEGKARARRAEIRKLADTLGTSDTESLSVAQQMAIQRYGQVQSELSKIAFDLMRAKGELRGLQRQASSDTADQEQPTDDVSLSNGAEQEVNLTAFEVEQALMSDFVYKQLLTSQMETTAKIDLYKPHYGEAYFRNDRETLRRIESEMASRKEKVLSLYLEEKEARVAAAGFDPSMSPEDLELARWKHITEGTEAQRGKLIGSTEIRVGVLEEQERIVREDVAKLEEETRKLGRSSVDIEMMRSEIDSLDEVLKGLAGEIERTRIELKSGSRVSVVSEAYPIGGDSKQKRLAMTGASGAAGLFLPFIAFVFFDIRKKLVSDSESLGRVAGVSILGAVPKGRDLSEGELASGQFGNSVSSVVAMLVHDSKICDRKVLMVTSASSGEGKSLIAESLWRVLANANYRVLLLDFDMRRPSVHLRLKTDLGMGVSDVLGGQATSETAIQELASHQHFMTAGSSREINLAGVARNALPCFFEQLRPDYDFIIVDTPPVLPIVDSRVIGEHVDGAVLSVMRDRSRVPQLIATRELLLAHGTPLIGVVVNGCPDSAPEYSYSPN